MAVAPGFSKKLLSYLMVTGMTSYATAGFAAQESSVTPFWTKEFRFKTENNKPYIIEPTYRTPMVVTDNSILFSMVASDQRSHRGGSKLFAINRESGELLWKSTLEITDKDLTDPSSYYGTAPADVNYMNGYIYTKVGGDFCVNYHGADTCTLDTLSMIQKRDAATGTLVAKTALSGNEISGFIGSAKELAVYDDVIFKISSHPVPGNHYQQTIKLTRYDKELNKTHTFKFMGESARTAMPYVDEDYAVTIGVDSETGDNVAHVLVARDLDKIKDTYLERRGLGGAQLNVLDRYTLVIYVNQENKLGSGSIHVRELLGKKVYKRLFSVDAAPAYDGDKGLYAVSRKKLQYIDKFGHVRWSTDLPANTDASPVIYKDNLILSLKPADGSTSSKLMMISRKSHEIKYTVNVDVASRQRVMLVKDDVLYISDNLANGKTVIKAVELKDFE